MFAFSSLAKSCGFALPAPVLSSSATMLVVFHSDETETFGGFRAMISFIHVAGNRSNLGNCLLGQHNGLFSESGYSELFYSRRL